MALSSYLGSATTSNSMITRDQTISNNVIHLRNISPSSYYVVATSSAINGRDYSKNDFSIYNDSELRYNGTL